MQREMKRGLIASAACVWLAAAVWPGGAAAHPHVWIDAYSEVIFDAAQRMTALRVSWRFDEFYSLFAIEGLDKDGDGTYTPAELQPLADLNVTSLKEYGYFTEVRADGEPLAYGPVSGTGARYEDGILTLAFTIPLATPVDPLAAEVSFRSYDPTFYIAIEPALQDPVTFAGDPPPSCRAVVQESDETPETLTLSETDFADPQGGTGGGIGALYATTLVLACDPAEKAQ